MQIKKINEELLMLHDSLLVSMEDNTINNIIKLTFLAEDKGEQYILTINDVVTSRCQDWKFGNIVLDAYITDINDINFNINDITKKIIFVNDLTIQQIKLKQYQSILEDIMNEKKFILEINPSYGAYFIAIFTNCSFTHSISP
jgi:hypothetical protein